MNKKRIADLIRADIIMMNGGKNRLKSTMIIFFIFSIAVGFFINSAAGMIYAPIIMGVLFVPMIFANEQKYHSEKMYAMIPVDRKEVVRSRFIMTIGLYTIVCLIIYTLMLIAMKAALYKKILGGFDAAELYLDKINSAFGAHMSLFGLNNLLFWVSFSMGLSISAGTLRKYFKNGKSISLKEAASAPGVYRAQFVIDPEQKPKTVKAVYRLKDPTTHTNTKITAKEKIKILSEKESLRTAQITSDGVKLRKIPTARENLYPFYRAYGNVQINGRLNEQYRIRLNDSETAWLEMDKLRVTETTANTPNHLQEMNLTVQPDKTRLTFAGKHPVPISVHEFNNRFELTFYYTDGFDENFTADTTSPVVENVTWSEPEKNTILFKIYFRPDTLPWGHAYDFEDGNLVLDFIHNPTLTPTKNKPLAGARILLDAGHSPRRKTPYDGAVGPTGYLEYEATLALAEDLKPLLEKQGATVILTRRGNNRKSLQERYEQALQENAHIFVSLHYNALPETINPLSRHRGYSVYYNYPHSFKLAQAVYQSFTKNVKLPDNGMIANDVLFIPRIPQIPSILVENAYMMIPEQEQMARTKQGRAPLVKALYEGILKFYGVKVPPQPQKKTAKKARRSSQKPAKKTYLRAGPKPVLKAGK